MLGFNLVRWYSENYSDLTIYILTRRRSIERRRGLYILISSFPNVYIMSSQTLNYSYLTKLIRRIGCPNMAYILIGSIYGDVDGLYYSNAVLPY